MNSEFLAVASELFNSRVGVVVLFLIGLYIFQIPLNSKIDELIKSNTKVELAIREAIVKFETVPKKVDEMHIQLASSCKSICNGGKF